MKILIATGIYPPEIGGPATFSRELARELKRRGHEPVVLCYGDEKTIKDEGWGVSIVPRKGGAFMRYIRYAWRCFILARGLDVVFLQGPVSEGLPGTIGAWFAGKPVLMKIVGDYAWEIHEQTSQQSELLDDFVAHRHAGKIEHLERIERCSAKRARRIVVPSRYLKKIVALWGIPEEKIQVLYNTVKPFASDSSPQAWRKGFGLEGKKILFCAGRLVPWKNFDFLIGLMDRLPEDYVLVIGGDGPCAAEWKNEAQRFGSRIIFLGPIKREAVGAWLRAADVNVLPSGYEGFPHAVAEAASLGTPSFVSDKGGNPETKELYPQLVTVLPYLDEAAWIKALHSIPPRGAPVFSASFEDLVQDYLEILKKVCAS